MRSALNLLLAVILLLTASCDYIRNYDRPHLELTGQSPYTLNITKFSWGYGLVGFNQFSGDFDKLDENVYDLLKDKSGTCQVYMQAQDNDKYGNKDSTMKYIGDINIDELNKYQDWHYWQTSAGIRTLLYKQIQGSTRPMADSAKAVNPTDTVRHVAVTTPANSQAGGNAQPNTYLFSIDDLYTTKETPSTLEQNRFVINGTIGDVDFDNGVFQVVTTDSGQVTVQFYPSKASSNTALLLLQTLKSGNTIRCVGEQVNATTYDLLAAKITTATIDTIHITKKM